MSFRSTPEFLLRQVNPASLLYIQTILHNSTFSASLKSHTYAPQTSPAQAPSACFSSSLTPPHLNLLLALNLSTFSPNLTGGTHLPQVILDLLVPPSKSLIALLRQHLSSPGSPAHHPGHCPLLTFPVGRSIISLYQWPLRDKTLLLASLPNEWNGFKVLRRYKIKPWRCRLQKSITDAPRSLQPYVFVPLRLVTVCWLIHRSSTNPTVSLIVLMIAYLNFLMTSNPLHALPTYFLLITSVRTFPC